MSLLDYFENMAGHIKNPKIQQLQELVKRFCANKIDGFRNLMRSYPNYVVDDEKKIRFLQRVTKRNSDLTTNDASCSSKYST